MSDDRTPAPPSAPRPESEAPETSQPDAPDSGASHHTPLLIAAHGTRDAVGVAHCRALVERVARMLPGTQVSCGYVELVEPTIEDALADLLGAHPDSEAPEAVVVPLMLGRGGHVRDDIPGSIAAAQERVPNADIRYARPLGDDPRLLDAVASRIEHTLTHRADGTPRDQPWEARDVIVVLLGRGAKVADANADHARLARALYEQERYAQVLPAYLQVARPSLPEALGQAKALGALLGTTRIVVAPHFLLPGLLRTWTGEQVDAWTAAHPDVEVALAEIIGDCDELAAVLVDRYREAAEHPAVEPGAPVYLSGLRLSGRDVLVVGAGRVADRRVPRLLAAGARVRLVSPTLSVRLRGLLRRESALVWEQRPYADGDVAGAWYVLAATNDPLVNAAVAAEAEAARVFCVRADASAAGTAWTPAVETADGLTVAVVGQRDPRRSVRVRDALVRALRE